MQAGSLFVGTATATLSPGKHRLREAVMSDGAVRDLANRHRRRAELKSHQTALGNEKARATYRAVAIRLLIDANRYMEARVARLPLYSYAEQLRYGPYVRNGYSARSGDTTYDVARAEIQVQRLARGARRSVQPSHPPSRAASDEQGPLASWLTDREKKPSHRLAVDHAGLASGTAREPCLSPVSFHMAPPPAPPRRTFLTIHRTSNRLRCRPCYRPKSSPPPSPPKPGGRAIPSTRGPKSIRCAAAATCCWVVVDSGAWADRGAAFFSSLLFPPFPMRKRKDERPRDTRTTCAYNDVLTDTEARKEKAEMVSESARLQILVAVVPVAERKRAGVCDRHAKTRFDSRGDRRNIVFPNAFQPRPPRLSGSRPNFQEAMAPSQPSFSRLPPCFIASPVLGNPVCSLPACLVSCFL